MKMADDFDQAGLNYDLAIAVVKKAAAQLVMVGVNASPGAIVIAAGTTVSRGACAERKASAASVERGVWSESPSQIMRSGE
jgi:hypothetical protein